MFSKYNIYAVKLKRNFLTVLFIFFTLGLLIFSNSNLPAVKSGLELWVTSVIPSLFPFFVATELLQNTSIISYLGHLLDRFMKPIFNISGEGAFCFIMGLISGYPVGAKIACDFRKNDICSKEECERLLSFTNNSGPLFVLGTVGILMYKNSTIGLLLLFTHVLASITVGIIFRFWKKSKNSNGYKNFSKSNKKVLNSTVSLSNLGEILSKSITSSISTILLIGGFIVIFASIISILKSSGILNMFTTILTPLFNNLNIDSSFIGPLLTGFLEITSGISSISNIAVKKISLNIIFTSFLLRFWRYLCCFASLEYCF